MIMKKLFSQLRIALQKTFEKKVFSAHRGFVILFTILISAIIMMIGIGIFTIATRETILSSTSREAQSAFYAADAGVECALYAQANARVGGTGTSTNISCGAGPNGTGNLVDITGNGTQGSPFTFDVMLATNACSHVNVIYNTTNNTARVISEGYNICNYDSSHNIQPAKSNPILVERLLDTTYSIAPVAGGSPAPSGGGGNNNATATAVNTIPIGN